MGWLGHHRRRIGRGYGRARFRARPAMGRRWGRGWVVGWNWLSGASHENNGSYP
jgi:hypothetical protein